jgi:hypothetical protein
MRICRKINGIIQNLSATLEGDAGGSLLQREVKKVLVVAILIGVYVVHLIQM